MKWIFAYGTDQIGPQRRSTFQTLETPFFYILALAFGVGILCIGKV